MSHDRPFKNYRPPNKYANVTKEWLEGRLKELAATIKFSPPLDFTSPIDLAPCFFDPETAPEIPQQ